MPDCSLDATMAGDGFQIDPEISTWYSSSTFDPTQADFSVEQSASGSVETCAATGVVSANAVPTIRINDESRCV